MTFVAHATPLFCFVPCPAHRVEAGLCRCVNWVGAIRSLQLPSPVLSTTDLSKNILLGLAVGDALGVPFEFLDRHVMARKPATDMVGMGTHAQPAGTFSDDASLAFCLAESLTRGYDLQDIANKCADWFFRSYWAAHGRIFDVGLATRAALDRVRLGYQPALCGGMDEDSNGNGSLMRILPLLPYLLGEDDQARRYWIVKDVSSITHAHVRSVIGCFYYLEYARLLVLGWSKHAAYEQLQADLPAFLAALPMNPDETARYRRLLQGDIRELPADQIWSSGYVVHTLEASIWCLLTTDSYAEATLKAVNLGSDTDTTASVTGGLAGLVFGWESIPAHWVSELARLQDILNLAQRLDAIIPPLPAHAA